MYNSTFSHNPKLIFFLHLNGIGKSKWDDFYCVNFPEYLESGFFFVDTFFYYTAVVGVSHLRLPWWAEPFAGKWLIAFSKMFTHMFIY